MGRIDTAREIVSCRGWLGQAPPAFRKAVLDRCTYQKVASGQSIYLTGDPPGGMYGLVSGGLAVSLVTGERGPYFAHFFGAGSWFGEGPAITGRPRLVGLAAARQTELFHLPLHAVDDVIAEDPSRWRLFAGLALGKLEIALGAVDDLMIPDSRKRFIAVLLRVGGCRTALPPAAVPIEVYLSQDDLATMANISRSTATSILRELSASGLIKASYRRLEIRSADGLRQMLG